MSDEKGVLHDGAGITLQGSDHKGLIATGGIVAALGASSCCVLPLALTLMGVSGAWMSNLRALEAWQPLFAGIAIVMLAAGFYLVYLKPGRACAPGSACARPLPNRLVKTVLWFSALLILVTLTFPLTFPLILPFLP